MKNIKVQALIDFDDYEGRKIKPDNKKIHRAKNDIFNCTKERYEYLLKNNAVVLVGIDKEKKKY